jgi:hypothetical protein
MGPIVEPTMKRLVLRPFRTSQTYRNLKALGEGVFHVTDDVLLIAKSAIGTTLPVPEVSRALTILGYMLEDACRAYEFRVTDIDERGDRIAMNAEVTHSVWRRDFFGFNRGKNAVLEAAILATRIALLPREDILRDFERFEVIVAKTGGEPEREAMSLLREFVERATSCEREA